MYLTDFPGLCGKESHPSVEEKGFPLGKVYSVCIVPTLHIRTEFEQDWNIFALSQCKIYEVIILVLNIRTWFSDSTRVLYLHNYTFIIICSSRSQEY